MGTIADLNNLSTPAANDFWVVRDVSDVLDPDKKVMLGEFGLIDLPNTWTGNQAINGLATTGSAFSVTRNLTATSTDAPVVDIIQDHASDDQIALRIRQDGSAVALDITTDVAGSSGISSRNLNAGAGAHCRSIINALGGDPYVLFQAGVTPTQWAVGVDTSDATKFTISQSSALGTNDRMVIDTAGFVGIGTAAPYNFLHVMKSAVTGSDAHPNDIVVVENNTNCSINIIANPANVSQIMFSDDVRARGHIDYDHATDGFSIWAAATSSFTLSSAGLPTFPAMTVLAGTAVHCSAGGTLYKATSSQRYKRNIRDLSDAYGDSLIKALRPVLYQERHYSVGDERKEYGEKDKSPDRVGLISEEVYKASGEAFVMLDADGKPDGLSYERLVAPLIGAVQRLMERVEKLEAKLAT